MTVVLLPLPSLILFSPSSGSVLREKESQTTHRNPIEMGTEGGAVISVAKPLRRVGQVRMGVDEVMCQPQKDLVCISRGHGTLDTASHIGLDEEPLLLTVRLG